MDNVTMSVMTLVTATLTERIVTLMMQMQIMRAHTMLMMTIMLMQTGILMPVMIKDSDNSENDAVNVDTDADSFDYDNGRAKNVGTYNNDDDIDATDVDHADAISNDNCDPDDT